ncbi:hypothetical protein C8R46DRAFT_1042386 [Mycena filopes]|nr:hypothetical protein C8R46DRAFT_1042386 [Mycena filopes]
MSKKKMAEGDEEGAPWDWRFVGDETMRQREVIVGTFIEPVAYEVGDAAEGTSEGEKMRRPSLARRAARGARQAEVRSGTRVVSNAGCKETLMRGRNETNANVRQTGGDIDDGHHITGWKWEVRLVRRGAIIVFLCENRAYSGYEGRQRHPASDRRCREIHPAKTDKKPDSVLPQDYLTLERIEEPRGGLNEAVVERILRTTWRLRTKGVAV